MCRQPKPSIRGCSCRPRSASGTGAHPSVDPTSSHENATGQRCSGLPSLRGQRDLLSLHVTSRKVIGLFPEQLRLEFVPVLDRLHGRPAAEGCSRAQCRGASICRRSARSCRSAQPGPMQAHHWPEAPPAPLVSSWLGCDDESAWSHPVPNVPQTRSCHEKRRAPRGNVIIRDGTVKDLVRFFDQRNTQNPPWQKSCGPQRSNRSLGTAAVSLAAAEEDFYTPLTTARYT